MFRTNAGRIGGRVIPGTLSAPGVWSMAEQSTYKRGGDWPGTLDPYYASVRLLLQMDGSNNSTSFPDTSSSPKTATPTGNARISTDQSRFGESSAYFDGDGDSLVFDPSSAWSLGGTDFTIECFARKDLNRDGVIVGQGSNWRLRFTNSGAVAWDTSGTNRYTTTAQASSTWLHIAVSKIGTTTRIFVNGTSLGTTTSSVAANSTIGLTVGGLYSSTSYQGFIDSLRITAVGRYGSDFTPPSLPFPNG